MDCDFEWSYLFAPISVAVSRCSDNHSFCNTDEYIYSNGDADPNGYGHSHRNTDIHRHVCAHAAVAVDLYANTHTSARYNRHPIRRFGHSMSPGRHVSHNARRQQRCRRGRR